jgi:V8-like Glu-specific endopeptidase
MLFKKILVLCLLLNCFQVLAASKKVDVVYGEDDRFEPYQRPLWFNHTRAVAGRVKKIHNGTATLLGFPLHTFSLGQAVSLCIDEQFQHQPILPDCSAFLVAPDVLMTAGHCVMGPSDCAIYNWIFDYEMTENEAPTFVAKENVFQCKSIIAHSYGIGKPDYALIRLDRPTHREPLKLLASSLSAQKGDSIVMIGHPSGLPLKVTEGAKVLALQPGILVTNLDAFQGNSGSPVLDEKSGLVVGILVSGLPDYRSDEGCNRVNRLEEDRGSEKVTSIEIVPRFY